MTNVAIVIGLAILLLLLEYRWPNARLPRVDGWYPRAFLCNGLQAAIACSGGWLWDAWFAGAGLFDLGGLPLLPQAGLGYLTITFVYYWWHRARHENPYLWRYLHQLHHSPARLEVLTSFYKHPAEILVNAILSSSILYLLLGLDPGAAALSVLLTGIAELFYHVNLKTPRALGWFFQRPEMHRLHHRRGRHDCNYSDLPLWDLLFGTYRNPAHPDVETGFPDNNERKIWSLLAGKEIRA